MKILFVLLHPGYVRNYESTIRLLAERGHHIHLCFNLRKEKSEDILPVEKMAQENQKIFFDIEPLPKREDIWKNFTKAIRGCRDYLRYFHPEYKEANKLRQRAQKRLGPILGVPLRSFCLLTGFAGVRLLSKCLEVAEKAVPPDKAISRLIASQKPDLVLVTPLVDFASVQTDYVKSTKATGIKCGLCVASWDNLTNKGLIRIEPDKVIVWNEIQKREAVELHNIPPHKVAITGAQCYDKWFEQKPSTTKKEFCRKVGLREDRSFILYLCSSPFIAPYEVGFVEKWIQQVRSYDNPALKEIGILVRPHPQNAKQWEKVDFSSFENVAIYPRKGANPVSKGSKAEFFDSMFHSVAVVGINTSAMIEAGILDKPVHTILSPDFRDTQEGTLHFHYLAQGGLVYIANDFAEHLRQLVESLNENQEIKEKRRNFIKSFIRPYGLEMPSTPMITEEIEKLGNSPPIHPEVTPSWVLLLRIALLPLALLINGIVIIRRFLKRSNGQKEDE